jgi:hypothetical protein
MRALGFANQLNSSATTQQINDQNDYSDDEQQMDQTASHVKTKPQQPQNQQDHEYGPKHEASFKAIAGYAITLILGNTP